MKRIIAIICLLAMATLMLVSCGTNFEGMKKKLEDKGYSATYLTKEMIEKDDTDDLSTAGKIVYAVIEALVEDVDVEGILVGVKASGFDVDSVMVIEFTKAEDAEAVSKELGDDAVRSGKVVYVGDEDSIKIVK